MQMNLRKAEEYNNQNIRIKQSKNNLCDKIFWFE